MRAMVYRISNLKDLEVTKHSLDNKIPGFGEVSLRGGLKSGMKNLNTDDKDFGFATGAGVKLYFLNNKALTIDYTYKTMGILGNIQAYTVGLTF